MFNFFSEIKKELINENALLGNFNIINMSNQVVYIEGHKGIVSISKDSISLKVKKALIKIYGEDLILRKITKSTLIVEGKIKSVETQ